MEFAKKMKLKERLSEPRKRDYNTHLNILTEWVKKINKEKIPFKRVGTGFIHEFFDYLIEEREVADKTFNNYRTTLHALYNTLSKRSDFDVKNVISKIESKEYECGNNHIAYSPEQYEAIIKTLRERNKIDLLIAVNIVYYCFMRPTEVIKIQRKHLLQDVIEIPGRRNTKIKHKNYRQIPKKLNELFNEFNIRSLPDEAYIIKNKASLGIKPVSEYWLSKRFSSILKVLKLDNQGYDFYGLKHTGNIALYKNKRDLRLNMLQNGHTSIEMTRVYLRNLGIILEQDLLDFE